MVFVAGDVVPGVVLAMQARPYLSDLFIEVR